MALRQYAGCGDAGGTAIELWLVVDGPAERSAEVAVEAHADTQMAEVVEALAAHLGVSGNSPLAAFHERVGRWLDPSEQIAGTELRQGDRLVLTRDRTHAPTRASVPLSELAIVGGPCAGTVVPVAESGTYRIGRNPHGDVVIEDPSMSWDHASLRIDHDRAAIVDLGSRNGTSVEGVAVAQGEERRLRKEETFRLGRTLLTIRPIAQSVSDSVAENGRIAFNRPPRIAQPFRGETIVVEAPPARAERPRLPLAASVVPLVMGLVLWAATRNAAMLLFLAMTPLMAGWTFVEERRGGTKTFAKRAAAFRSQIEAVRERLGHAHEEEAAQRRAAAPDVVELVRRAETHAPSLWDRRPADADFMSLRVGAGDQPSQTILEVEDGGDDELRQLADSTASEYQTVSSVPVVVPLADGPVGIAGQTERVRMSGRLLVAGTAVLHSPSDVVIAAAVTDDPSEDWSWLRWLPHTRSEVTPLEGPHIASKPADVRKLFEDVDRVVAERKEDLRERFSASAARPAPFVLLVVEESVALDRSIVSRILADGPGVGVSAVWLGRDVRALPGECSRIVEVDPAVARLTVTVATTGTTTTDVIADALSLELAHEVGRALAPVRDVSAAAARGQIPKRVSLRDLLDVPPESESLAGSWRGPFLGLTAVVGAAAEGPFAVDLRRDGPHAVVAGTTGAGKSELLQTLVASLAATHPPSRITFLLIDYKGGAAFKECALLPHTVGLVTDLDGHLTRRALVSLNAELRRREGILRDAGAKDLAELERRDAAAAPPSLVLVIDEFATLAKEVPEFVEGVVDVAQRGRSLGIHLVLATQRPSGVVSENIRANANLRIALRVGSRAESEDVIELADAARIPRAIPGRAYARTGHGELVEFQTAYVGGVTESETGPRVVVRELGFDGRAGAEPQSTIVDEADTDLRRLVSAAAATARAERLEPQRSPWLPQLAPVIALETLESPTITGDPGAIAILGVVDEPMLQQQRTYSIDLARDGSALVFGTSGSGKSALLRTIAVSLAKAASPRDVHLYGLDFATRGLTSLERLPHCGSVIAGEEAERVTRLFRFARRSIDERRNLFSRQGAFTIEEYRASAPDPPVPRIVVLLDGYAGFASAFERVDGGALIDALPRLVADGRPLGIHFVVTADRRGAIPPALAGIIERKIVLRMADEDEYAALGLDLRAVRGASLPPGRGFAEGTIELQCALVGDNPSGEGQGHTIAELGSELVRTWPGQSAPPIATLPRRIERAEIQAAPEPFGAVLGLADTDLGPALVDLANGHFTVVGRYRTGRSTALETIARSLAASTPDAELHLLAPRRSPLTGLDLWRSVANGGHECDAAAESLATSAATGPLVIVIDDGEELAESPGALALEALVRRGRDGQVRLVAAVETQAAQRAFSGWIRELRKEEQGLLLAPDLDVDGELLGARLPRQTNAVFPPGRGYLVVRGDVELVQVATGD